MNTSARGASFDLNARARQLVVARTGRAHGRPAEKEHRPMRVRKRVAKAAAGVATSAVVISLATAGVAHAAPAYTAPSDAAPTGASSQLINNTLVITGTADDDAIVLAPSTDP